MNEKLSAVTVLIVAFLVALLGLQVSTFEKVSDDHDAEEPLIGIDTAGFSLDGFVLEQRGARSTSVRQVGTMTTADYTRLTSHKTTSGFVRIPWSGVTEIANYKLLSFDANAVKASANVRVDVKDQVGDIFLECHDGACKVHAVVRRDMRHVHANNMSSRRDLGAITKTEDPAFSRVLSSKSTPTLWICNLLDVEIITRVDFQSSTLDSVSASVGADSVSASTDLKWSVSPVIKPGSQRIGGCSCRAADTSAATHGTAYVTIRGPGSAFPDMNQDPKKHDSSLMVYLPHRDKKPDPVNNEVVIAETAVGCQFTTLQGKTEYCMDGFNRQPANNADQC